MEWEDRGKCALISTDRSGDIAAECEGQSDQAAFERLDGASEEEESIVEVVKATEVHLIDR